MTERNQDGVRCLILTAIWIGAVLIGTQIFSGCDTGDVITEIIECQLPPGHCNMDDEEFSAMFDALTAEEQAVYIEQWGQPRDQRGGFVSQ